VKPTPESEPVCPGAPRDEPTASRSTCPGRNPRGARRRGVRRSCRRTS